MKKLTKLLSVFILAGAVGTGAAGISACKSDKQSNTHTHNYSYTPNLDGKTHTAVCDGCDEIITDQLHVDEDDNKECDLCKANLSQEQTPPDDGKDDDKVKDSVTKVEISGSKQVAVKSKITLTATVTVTGTAAKTVTWSTSDETKATVSATGEVTGVAEGSVTITATSTVDKTKKADYPITVVAEGTVIKPDPGEDPGEDPGTEKTLYEQLLAKDNLRVSIDSQAAAGTHLSEYDAATAGIYVIGDEGYESEAHIEYAEESGVKVIKQVTTHPGDNGKPNVYTIINPGPVKEEVEGIFSTKISHVGSNSNFIVFNGDVSVSIAMSKSGDDGALSCTYNNGTAVSKPVEGFTLKTNTYIQVYFKINFTEGKMTLKIDDVTVLDNEATGTTSFNYVQISSSNKGQRIHTTKDIAVCGTAKTLQDSKTDAKAAIAAELEKYDAEEYTINGSDLTAAKTAADTAVDEAQDIAAVYKAIADCKAAMAAVLKDSAIDAAREAAITALEEKLPADNYSYDFAADSDDKIYNNKSTYDVEIAAIKADINAATKQADLDALVENATISVGDNAAQLAAKKTAAKTAISAYRADEVAALETEHATQYDNITNAETGIIKTATDNIDGATTIELVNDALDDAKEDIDSEIQATQETLAETIARYQGYLENDGTTAKTGVTDQAKLDAVDAAVTAGKAALADATKENISRTYDAEKAKVQMVIPKFDAKAALSASATAALAEIQGTSTAATTATTAVNKAVTDGNAAIDAAANVAAIEGEEGELAKAQLAITTAMNTLKATEFDVQVKLGSTNIGKNIKVKYGATITISDSQLDLTDRQMVDKLYESDGTTEHSSTTAYYNAVTLVVTVKAAKTLNRNDSFKYSAIDKNSINKVEGKTDTAPIHQALFDNTQNSFMTILGTGVTYRDSNDCIELFGDAMQVSVLNGGTLTLTVSSTGSNDTNWSSIAVKDADGNYISATYTASGSIVADGNVYAVHKTTKQTFTYNLAQGTYTICTLNEVGSTATARKTRLFNLTIVESNKVPCDVTVTFGDGEAQQYYHDEDIALPETDPTGNGEFVGWYYGETKFEGGKLPAGNYTMVAKFEYTVKVTYNDGTENVDLYLNVANGSAIEDELPQLPPKTGEDDATLEHTGWALTDGGAKIDFSSDITVGTAASPATITLYPVYEASSKVFVTTITVTAAGNATSLEEGGKLQLTATTNADADDKTVTWTSSNNAIATVDATGKVTGVAEGEVAITATAKDGSGVTGTITLTVTQPSNKTGSLTLSVINTSTSISDPDSVITLSTTKTYKVKDLSSLKISSEGKEYSSALIGNSDGAWQCAITSTKAATVKIYVSCAADSNVRNTYNGAKISASSDVAGHTYADITTTGTTYSSSDKVNTLTPYLLTLELDANETVTITSTAGRFAILAVEYDYIP